MTKRILLMLALGLTLIANTAYAENIDFTGTYTMKASDNVLTLTLKQDSNGNIIGTLSSTTGITLKVEGMLSEKFAVGACYNDEMGAFFEAGFEGDILYFILIETDENNMPNYDKTTELSFTRSSKDAKSEPQNKTSPSLKDKIKGDLDKQEKQSSPKSKVTDSSEIGQDEIGDKSWGFKFKAPKDWVYRMAPDGVLLGHNTIAGLILVIVHNESSYEKMKADMAKGIEEEGVSLHAVGELKKLDDYSLSGIFEGIADNTKVKAYSIATISPLGGSGAYIIAITTPEQFKPELTGRVDEIFNSMKFFKAEGSDLMKVFEGKWTTVTKNTETSFYLYSNGIFAMSYSASYSDIMSGGGTNEWGVATDQNGDGQWTIRGTREKGIITLKYNNGHEEQIEYAVHVENGETYWNEYWFNGDLYARGAFD